jgi:mannosylglycoprotein endo-beta-mannosidase
LLSNKFTQEEVFEVINQMEHNKAPGPEGFPAKFYQHFWDVIKGNLMAMFCHFQNGGFLLFKLNFGIIALVPKKENAMQIQQYRPICLLNVSFNFFTKVSSNRVSNVAHKVVRLTQTAFMPGWHILGVVVLHETIHELHRKKLDGVLFKIDFEIAYDKVKWPFLQQSASPEGF